MSGEPAVYLGTESAASVDVTTKYMRVSVLDKKLYYGNRKYECR